MKDLYNIGIPPTVQNIIALFNWMGLWNIGANHNLRQSAIQLLYFMIVFGFTFLLATGAIGAYHSDNNDECILLMASSILNAIQLYRIWCIIQRQFEIRSLINRVGIHCTDDRNECVAQTEKLKMFVVAIKYFIFSIGGGALIFTVVSPFVSNEKKQILNLGLQTDWERDSTVAFWILYVFLAGSMYMSIVCCLVSILIWYLMFSFVIKYRLLESQFRNMGSGKSAYFESLVAAIESHKQIRESIDDFLSIFSTLFLLQVISSSVSICGATFTLAFSSHDDLMQDAMNCVVISYGLFDIFMITYLGNDIKFSSDRLSYCLFESHWYEQTSGCKSAMIIITEMLKKPQKLVVGKLFLLDLVTFTSIVNRAYSMFNVLKTMQK